MDTVNQIHLICNMSLGQETEKQENMIHFTGGINLCDLTFQQSEKGPSKEEGQKGSCKEIVVSAQRDKELRSLHGSIVATGW